MSHHPLVAPDWIRGITIRQPWTTCILTGAKTIENRPRPWSWRGWLLLHSSQRIDTPALRDPLVARTIHGRHLHTGVVLGAARLTACHQDPDNAPPCNPWAHPGSQHLVLTDIQELPRPVPVSGALGPWKPTQDLVDQVLLQLPHLRPLAAS
ncbi:hypothetical protein AB0D58_30625 [Streptomyces sp. NPDC048210]|uniref:hypothetical protein n=1 Tax=Streptomyces sp. NPDC048210 TaxID=3156657 RepID=UPI003429FD02